MKKGLLLINIGTPDAPTVAAVRRYLASFLSDKRVIDLPAPLRYILLYAFILPFRPKQSAHAYQKIWTKEGSPLLVYSQQLIAKLEQSLAENYQVALAMRYGNPSIGDALNRLKDCEQLTILPLYPQYSSAASGSSLEAILTQLRKYQRIPEIKIINEFYQHPQFIEAQAAMIEPLLSEQTHLLFSYHGIPERQLQQVGCKRLCQSICPPPQEKNTACYRAQCYQTSRLLAEKLGLLEQQYTSAFQSRLGKTPWIRPFTDECLEDLAAKGIKNLVLACPSFVTDCLETIEEIGIRAKEQWLQAGGVHFSLAPCLNASDDWVKAIIKIAELS